MKGAPATAESAAAPSYLDLFLAPLAPYLALPDVTDVFVNVEGEVWIEWLDGRIQRHAVPEMNDTHLWNLARQIANQAHQGISREHPMLAATLPSGARVQIVAPPATRGAMAIAIRKHVVPDLGLSDFGQGSAVDTSQVSSVSTPLVQLPVTSSDCCGGAASMLAAAVKSRKNILISGGTSTGKTTFLNALMKEIPADERLILIEDTPELKFNHANAVGLVAVKGELGEARVTTDDLLQAALRMRPDRIILGEIRGSEAYTFLRAVNTGHPGSLTTIHADSPDGAVEQLVLIILQSGTQMRREDIVHYVNSVVDVFVQLERVGGQRRVQRVMMRG